MVSFRGFAIWIDIEFGRRVLQNLFYCLDALDLLESALMIE